MKHDDMFKDFDKQFARTQKAAIAGMIVSAVVSVSVLLFAGWVVVKLLAHFGVI